jgi:hypothetical protein
MIGSFRHEGTVHENINLNMNEGVAYFTKKRGNERIDVLVLHKAEASVLGADLVVEGIRHVNHRRRCKPPRPGEQFVYCEISFRRDATPEAPIRQKEYDDDLDEEIIRDIAFMMSAKRLARRAKKRTARKAKSKKTKR